MVLANLLLVLTALVLAALLFKERQSRIVHGHAAHEGLEQLEHERDTGTLDRQGRKLAVRQRVERRLHKNGRLGRGHAKVISRLYK